VTPESSLDLPAAVSAVAWPRRCSRSATVPWGSGPPVHEVFPETREQGWWWHKIGNVLNAQPLTRVTIVI